MIRTVLGEITKEECGRILTHEHLLIDISHQYSTPKPTAYPPESNHTGDQVGVSVENFSRLRRDPYAVKDNLRIMDVETAIEEAKYFKFFGGGAMVEQTPIGVGRNMDHLVRISKESGVHIIPSTSLYTDDAIPEPWFSASAQEVADLFIKELTVGIDDTDIKAAIIGEIGTSMPITPAEWKSLEAAAIAHKATNAPISVHIYPWGTVGLDVVDYLTGQGVAPEKICICHIDVQFDVDYIRELLKKGVYVEFDNFGKEFLMDENPEGFGGGAFAQDYERVLVMKTLCDEGWAKQILLSNDICLKVLLHRYGGPGYDHLLRNILPLMKKLGIKEEDITQMLDINPAQFLEF